jgi:hypothetical protein
MDEYCPHVVLALVEAFETHPDAATMKEIQTTVLGSMFMQIFISCARRLLYMQILRHEQGLSAHDNVSIPESGIPELEELLLMMKEAGMNGNDNGDSSSDTGHQKRDEQVGAADPVLANAASDKPDSIPSDPSEKN